MEVQTFLVTVRRLGKRQVKGNTTGTLLVMIGICASGLNVNYADKLGYDQGFQATRCWRTFVFFPLNFSPNASKYNYILGVNWFVFSILNRLEGAWAAAMYWKYERSYDDLS